MAQNPAAIKAGDTAPELAWTKVLAAGDPGSRKPPNLFGRVTVLAFLPNVSANASLLSDWNRLVAKFADQHVEFISITSEKESRLKTFLEKNPVSGWMLLDPQGQTVRAYGMEQLTSTCVIVGVNGHIAGFTFTLPDEDQIKAVQEGRALAIQGDATDDQMKAILAGRAVRLDAEPYRFELGTGEGKPDIPPSYEVHISPTKTRGTIGSEAPDYWVQRGFDLPTVISRIYQTSPSRMVLPPSLETKTRYDFVFVPPHEMDDAAMRPLIQQGIEKHFHISVAAEARPMDVYIMTAVEGRAPKPKRLDEAGIAMYSLSFEWTESPPKQPISHVSAHGTTIKNFAGILERGLHRPIVDETNLKGTFDFSVKSNARSAEEFIEALRDQVGLLLTPAQRNIEMLVVTEQ